MNTIRIKGKDIDSFISLCKEEYGEDLSRSEAYQQLRSLLVLVGNMMPSEDRRIDMYVKRYKEALGVELKREEAEKDMSMIVNGALSSALSLKHRQELEHNLECNDEVFEEVLKLFFKTVMNDTREGE